jgi:hypothetical protein
LLNAADVAILGTMKPWSWHRTQALVLALLLGLGISLSFVQGSLMATEMAVSPEAAQPGCDGCGGGDDKRADAATCLSVCGSAAQGLIPGELLTPPSASRTGFDVADLLTSGRSNTPDHGPPKIPALG